MSPIPLVIFYIALFFSDKCLSTESSLLESSLFYSDTLPNYYVISSFSSLIFDISSSILASLSSKSRIFAPFYSFCAVRSLIFLKFLLAYCSSDLIFSSLIVSSTSFSSHTCLQSSYLTASLTPSRSLSCFSTSSLFWSFSMRPTLTPLTSLISSFSLRFYFSRFAFLTSKAFLKLSQQEQQCWQARSSLQCFLERLAGRVPSLCMNQFAIMVSSVRGCDGLWQGDWDMSGYKMLSEQDLETEHPSYCLTFCDEECIQHSLSNEYAFSMVFTILTLLISGYHIRKHLQNFNNPFFQSKIIIIMIMAPFYCVTSMGSFIWPSLEPYFTLTRDFYEAILLFTFFYLIFSYLAYDREQDKMEDKKVYLIMIECEKQVPHFFPFSLCQKPYQLTHWKKAKYFTYRCKKYVLQFLIVKVATTLIMYIVYPKTLNAHTDGIEDTYDSYALVSSIVTWIVAISASYSLYYLVLFYHALHKPLAPYSPLLKFLTIKITLFFTFWQRIMITIFEEQFLECFDQEAESFSASTIISSLENTLICFEMLVMAFAGGLAYNYSNYVSPITSNKGTFAEVIRDTVSTFKQDSRLIKPKKFGFDTFNMEEQELQEMKKDMRKSVAMHSFIKHNIKLAIVLDYFDHLPALEEEDF